MATAAALAVGSIASSAFGAREARKAGETAAAGQRAQGAAFREAGTLEAGQLRELTGAFQPFTAGGGEAAELEAALSGALGPEAQQAAIDAQVESPFTKFIEQRGRAQLGQGFAQSGGLGGGERLKALTEFGQGVATQSLSTQLQNLRSVRQQGFGAQGTIADILSRASGAEATGIRGQGTGEAGAASALAQGRLNRAGQIQTGISDITSTGALQLQGLFDRPPSAVA